MAGITGHGNQKLAELDNEVVLIGLEFPPNTFRGRGSQLEGELLQTLGRLLVLGEDRPEVCQRGRNLGPNTIDSGVRADSIRSNRHLAHR